MGLAGLKRGGRASVWDRVGVQMEDEERPGGKEGEEHAGQFPYRAKEKLGWGR